MSRIMCVATPKVKPVRKSARPDRPFGQGLTRYVPLAVLAPGFVEPSDEDRAWAAIHLNAEADDNAIGDMEGRALEAAYQDSIEHLQPGPVGVCTSCGEYAEALDALGRCDRCDREGTDATTRCQTGQRRVY